MGRHGALYWTCRIPESLWKLCVRGTPYILFTPTPNHRNGDLVGGAERLLTWAHAIGWELVVFKSHPPRIWPEPSPANLIQLAIEPTIQKTCA